MRALQHSPILVVVLICLQILGPVALWAADEQRGLQIEQRGKNIVTALQGEVTRRGDSTSDFQPLRFKDILALGDEIRTTEQSNTQILLGTSGLATLGPHTSIRVNQEENGQPIISLLEGQLELAAARSQMQDGEIYTVQTPRGHITSEGGLIQIQVHNSDRSAFLKRSSDGSQLVKISTTARIVPVALSSPTIETIIVREGSASVAATRTAQAVQKVEAGQTLQLGENEPRSIDSNSELARDTLNICATDPHCETPEPAKELVQAQQLGEAQALSQVLVGAAEEGTENDNAQADEGVILATTAGVGLSGGNGGGTLLASLFGDGSGRIGGGLGSDSKSGQGINDDNTAGRDFLIVQNNEPFVDINGGTGLLVFQKRHPVQNITCGSSAPSCRTPLQDIDGNTFSTRTETFTNTVDLGDGFNVDLLVLIDPVTGEDIPASSRPVFLGETIDQYEITRAPSVTSDFKATELLLVDGGVLADAPHGGTPPTSTLIVQGLTETEINGQLLIQNSNHALRTGDEFSQTPGFGVPGTESVDPIITNGPSLVQTIVGRDNKLVVVSDQGDINDTTPTAIIGFLNGAKQARNTDETFFSAEDVFVAPGDLQRDTTVVGLVSSTEDEDAGTPIADILGSFSRNPTSNIGSSGVSFVTGQIRTRSPINGDRQRPLTGGVVLTEETTLTVAKEVTFFEGSVNQFGETTIESATSEYFRLKPPVIPSVSDNRLLPISELDGSVIGIIAAQDSTDPDVFYPGLAKIENRTLAVLNGSKILPDGSNKIALLSILDSHLIGPSEALQNALGDPLRPDPENLSQGLVAPLIDVRSDASGPTSEVETDSGVVVRSSGLLNGITPVDQALLNASAPLIEMVNSVMTVKRHLIDLQGVTNDEHELLTASMKLPNDALVVVDSSQLNINGNFLNLNTGSATVTGLLFSIANSGHLNIQNGALLGLSGDSQFNLVSNAFGGFSGASDTLTINNGLCNAGCTPLLDATGAPFAPLPNGNQLQVAGGGTVNITSPSFTPFVAPEVPNIDIGPDDAFLNVQENSTVTISAN